MRALLISLFSAVIFSPVIYFGAGLLFLPLWIKLASRWEKRETWLLAMLINTGAFAGVLTLHRGDTALFAVLVALSAIGYGATLAIPASMQADVIDYDELHSGKRREGEYVGIWSIAKKLAAALGAGLAFPILQHFGYQPGAEQSESVQTALKYLYAGVPSVCNLFAMLIAQRYPITKAMHAEIRKEIDSR